MDALVIYSQPLKTSSVLSMQSCDLSQRLHSEPGHKICASKILVRQPKGHLPRESSPLSYASADIDTCTRVAAHMKAKDAKDTG